ncbi:MAG: response regulator transcription factor [Bacteroidota bacterium]
MKRILVLYGVLMAALIGLLKYLDYRFLVRDFSWEGYVGIISVIFTLFGIWLGIKWAKPNQPLAIKNEESLNSDLKVLDLADSGLSEREYEVLQLMAKGLSNQEIADQLHISLNTVKTHTSNLYSKLDVRRRTQAVQKAKELGLLL